MTGKRGADQRDCRRSARPFAEAQAEGQERIETHFRKGVHMALLRRHVGRQAVIKRRWGERVQNRRRRTGNKSINEHGNAPRPGAGNRAGHGGNFAPAQGLQNGQRRAITVAGKPKIHYSRLAFEPFIVNARTAPDPGRAIAAEQSRENRRACGGIADPHFANGQKIGIRAHRIPADGQGRDQLGLCHRRGGGEIRRGAFQIDGINIEAAPNGGAYLIDGRAAGLEIRDHLHGDLGRESRHTLRGNPMISSKNNRLRMGHPRRGITAPAAIPPGDLFQAAEGTGGLGQYRIAGYCRLDRGLIGAGKLGYQCGKFCRGRKFCTCHVCVLPVLPKLRLPRLCAASILPPMAEGNRNMTDDIAADSGTAQDFHRTDIGAALGLLTRLPVPPLLAPGGAVLRSGAWAYPLVGLGIGFVTGVLLWGLVAIGMLPAVAAALALGVQMLITGAMHEDGLADTADGLGGGKSRDHALTIMRDSRIGTFGIVALTLTLIGKWAAVAALAPGHPIAALCLVGAVSRFPMVLIMVGMKTARRDGLSVMMGRPPMAYALAASAIAAIAALVFGGFWFPVLLFVAVLAPVPIIFWASRALDGQTGDILGASQQCAELALLALLTIIWI